MTENDKKNKELVELLGLCWHEWVPNLGHDGCNEPTLCKKCHKYPCETPPNPDFTTDAGKVQLLRLMYDKGEWYSVFALEDLMIDTTGTLLDACLKWLQQKSPTE